MCVQRSKGRRSALMDRLSLYISIDLYHRHGVDVSNALLLSSVSPILQCEISGVEVQDNRSG